MTSPPWLKIVKVSRRKYLFAPSVSITFYLEVRISPVGYKRTKFEKRNAWVVPRLQSLFIFACTCQQIGMGTSQAAKARAIIWRARHAAFLACVKKQKFCQRPWQHVQSTKWVQISNHISAAIPCRITYFSPNEVQTFYEIKWETNYRPVGRGLQIFGLITLPLVINYALLGWAKKLKSSKCWWGQCVLVIQAIFRICGNESQPGLQLVERLATPLHVTILREIYCRL